MPLFQTYLKRPRYVGPRNKEGGAFSICPWCPMNISVTPNRGRGDKIVNSGTLILALGARPATD